MTKIFFVRHAKPDRSVKGDRNRPLDSLSSDYGYDDFIRMMDWMPNIVEIVFDGKEVAEINELAHIDVS